MSETTLRFSSYETDSIGNFEIPPEARIAFQMVCNGVVISQTILPHQFHRVAAVQAHVVGSPVEYKTGKVFRVTLVPWAAVEEIAKYIEGDGTDAQRLALADGIRNRKWP